MTSSRRVPSVADIAVALGTGAAVVLALVSAPLLLGSDERVEVTPAWWASGGILVGQALVLCFARVAPRTVLMLTAAGAALLGVAAPTGLGSLADAAVLIAVLRTTLLVAAPRLRLLLPAAGLLVIVGQAADILATTGISVAAAIGAALLQAIAIVGLPSVGVLAVSARRDARRARRGESEAMRRERAAVVQAAVSRERTAMARELHDIAAHHVSSIALMSAAIERQIAADPDAARASVRQVREQSRVLLDDLRQLVGLLRRDEALTAGVETLETIPELVETARAAGRSVDLDVVSGRSQVGPLGQLVVYRMVQEALANAARHAAGAACRVMLDGSADDVFVATVRNGPGVTDAPVSAPEAQREGFGLLGMRERAELVGGTLAAGRDLDGGWTVRLSVPAEQPAGEGESMAASAASRGARAASGFDEASA